MMTQDKAQSIPVVLTLSVASRRYNVPRTTLVQWIDAGKLTELWEGPTRVVLEAEVKREAEARLVGKPQARDVLGEYIREDDAQPADNE